jgi:H+/Cl- antiporter ClcA
MTFIRGAISEFLGLFIDDGSAALHIVLLIAAVTDGAETGILSPILAAGALLGCRLVLSEKPLSPCP